MLVIGFLALSAGLYQGLVFLGLSEPSLEIRGLAILWVLLAGVYEEIIYRGGVQRLLIAAGVGTFWGVLLTAMLFGLAHDGLVHVVFAFILGIYLGIVAQWEGSIRTSIACHVLNNAVALAVLS